MHGIVPMAHSSLGGGAGGHAVLISDPAVRAAVEVMQHPSTYKETLREEGGVGYEHGSGGQNHSSRNPLTLAQILVQWALRRNCGIVASSGNDAHARALIDAGVAMTPQSATPAAVGGHQAAGGRALAVASDLSLSLLDEIPVDRYLRRHAPPCYCLKPALL